jgi:hypothetical protein
VSDAAIKLLVLVGLCAAAVFGYLWWEGVQEDEGDARGAARVQAQWDRQISEQKDAALAQANANAHETMRRLEHQQRNQHAQDELLARVRRTAAANAAAADGLRLQAAAYLDAAGCGRAAGDSAVECVRKAAARIGDVLGSCAARHGELAAAADDARARGLKCEADYDALTLKSTAP